MKYTAALIAASAALSSAQVTYNSTTGVFTCPPAHANGAFCAGDSLTTNIIIRCLNGVGQPGNCNDNLSGEFPTGVNYAPCWETSVTSGDAACSKNCIVYGGSGAANGTFTLPNCTPIPNPATSSTTASATSVSTTVTSTGTVTSISTVTTAPTTAPTLTPSGRPVASGNGTYPTSGSATATPVGPTTSTTPSTVPFTGAAVTNSAKFSLAGLGLLIAYFL